MSADYEVRYDPVALTALQEAASYIGEQSGPGRSAAWLRATRESIQNLESHPRAFPLVGTQLGRPLHSKIIMSHRVFYFVDDPTRIVYIIDVVHTARETKLAEYRGDGD